MQPAPSQPSRSVSTTSPPVRSDRCPEALVPLAAAPYLLSMGSTRAHKDLPTLLARVRGHRALAARAEAAAGRRRATRLCRGHDSRRAAGDSRAHRLHRPSRRRRPAGTHGGSGRVRVSLSVRGLRPAAARGDGARNAHGRSGRRVAARGRRRRCAHVRARRCAGTCRRPRRDCSTMLACASA